MKFNFAIQLSVAHLFSFNLGQIIPTYVPTNKASRTLRASEIRQYIIKLSNLR